MLRGQSGALDFQNILGSIVSFIAALSAEDSPHEQLLTRAQHSIPFVSCINITINSVLSIFSHWHDEDTFDLQDYLRRLEIW
jgi:hypothetical protein